MDKEYKYQEASMAELDLRWDINIANNLGDDRWVAWKSEIIENNKNNAIKTFVVLYDNEPKRSYSINAIFVPTFIN